MKLILFYLGLIDVLLIDNPINNQEPTFTITDTKLYVPVVNLSTQDNGKTAWTIKIRFYKIN